VDQETLDNLRARADAKLRYAEVHLEELKTLDTSSGSDNARAHLESFLFHLFGAKDVFLIELNVYYGGGLRNTNLSMGKLWKALRKQGRRSPELAELHKLERDKASWLSHAKGMRDHSTHLSGVPHHFRMYVGSPAPNEVRLSIPDTDKKTERQFVEDFEDWASEMRDLLERLRSSAIATMRARTAPEHGSESKDGRQP
jgi:hypothetical protein